MWYSGFDGTNNRVGYATLPIMDSWEKYSGNPVVDIGNPGEWDDLYVRSPAVIYDGTIYHMWYSGNGGPTWKIGYANSTDGINWNKYSGNPVLDVGAGWWEAGGVLEPYVLFDGAIYHMWYSGDDGTTTRRICYANSTDRINWNKYSGNPVLDLGSPSEWDDSSVYAEKVIFNGSTYQMWYTGRDPSSNRIGYATSPDGLSWTRYPGNPVMDLGPPGSWEDLHVYVPSIIYDGSIYQMWYGGGNSSFISTGYATSVDGINWQRYPGNPVINTGPPGSFDDFYSVPSTVLFDGFTYHNWYTANDGTTYRIGYTRIVWEKLDPFAEVIDAYEITGVNAQTEYTIELDVPLNADLDMFLFNTTGGRGDAISSSTHVGADIDESISFTVPIAGNYLLIITNENGGTGNYIVSFVDDPPVITNVIAQPNPQAVYGSVNISANITDDYQLFGAHIEIDYPNGSYLGNFDMLNIPLSSGYFLEMTHNVVGQYSFTIWANDTNNNWAYYSSTFTIQDITPPSISDVIVNPDPQEVFGFVNISAQVSDNYQVEGVWVEVHDPNGLFVDNFTMLYNSLNDRYYREEPYDLLGVYTFTIFAMDVGFNWVSASGTFVIHDTTPPLISSVSADPDPQEVFGDVLISAEITDNFQLDGVWVEIYDPNGILIGNFSMMYDSINERYYHEQSYDILGDYTFTIFANDTSNNRASVQGNFTIQDTIPPTILDITVEPNPQKLNAFVKITAKVTDNYQLDGVWIEIADPDGNSLGAFPMLYDPLNELYIFNQTYEIHGEYTFTIWANDTSNNLASETGSFEIEPKSEPDEYNWKPIIALIFTVILMIIGLVVVYNRPMKFTGDLSKDRWYSFFAGVLPFAIAEALTGIVSYFTGLLAVPPIIGLGMIVDLVILIIGILSCLIVYKKGVTLESYVEDINTQEINSNGNAH
jgi:hypothetical protein